MGSAVGQEAPIPQHSKSAQLCLSWNGTAGVCQGETGIQSAFPRSSRCVKQSSASGFGAVGLARLRLLCLLNSDFSRASVNPKQLEGSQASYLSLK